MYACLLTIESDMQISMYAYVNNLEITSMRADQKESVVRVLGALLTKINFSYALASYLL
jgi:hypothetical protein